MKKEYTFSPEKLQLGSNDDVRIVKHEDGVIVHGALTDCGRLQLTSLYKMLRSGLGSEFNKNISCKELSGLVHLIFIEDK